jgi:hypothetical protein
MKTEEIGQEFLEHHGVKGMHWGIRREQMRTTSETRRAGREAVRREMRVPSPVRATPTIGRSSFTKSKVKTVGGEDHPPHEDAVKVAVAKQKMRKSGVVALSNAELQTMAQRMQLESQVHSLVSKQPKSIGRGFVDAHLKRLQNDPVGEIEKAHKFRKGARTALGVAAAIA